MADRDPYGLTRDEQGNAFPRAERALNKHTDRVGRYRIIKILGDGGLGVVYLAHDEQLDRPVALRVPHAELVSSVAAAEAYFAEARMVANLDHPHIAPVHDVGSTHDFPCFVVSKYVEGSNLSMKLKQSPFTCAEAAELVATVADALHHAHTHGVVHRDVKPGNILIGLDGKPYVVDFGLVPRDERVSGDERPSAGAESHHPLSHSRHYISPEQTRGEGHRVNERSDIFCLGVVFYELLTGRRPFRGDTQSQLFEQVTSFEPQPIRRFHDQIPRELERICEKAIAKRARDRYATAKEFADDLRHWQVRNSESAARGGGVPSRMAGSEQQRAESISPLSDSALPLSDLAKAKIVPKGLRSFDAHDADFFLGLLPGPRDRDGLPDSIRFWKTRIEETDPGNTFPVGVIYGPSGCGKSSLVKAGVLPRLSDAVIAVCVEATDGETETRVVDALRGSCGALEDDLNLHDTLASLRRGKNIPEGKKVLVVIDQFEQWLHGNKEHEHTELVQALRQCDGGRLQCILLVRDDFWLATTRFMGALEVDLLHGQNSAMADLFGLDHARKVLAAFGRAFGKLPDNVQHASKQQREFLKQAVTGLAEEGRVICVRLALFAEMMKDKAWVPATLRSVGGIEGIGVTFLEETFSARAADPKHRFHQQAARGVLSALLPEEDSPIKGQMKSHDQLLEASGYAHRPHDFDDVVRLLDSELRLITPTELRVESPESRAKSSESDDDHDRPPTLDSRLWTLFTN